MLKTSDFDYQFPENMIASHPADKRDHSRLMVLNRTKQTIEHCIFYQIIDYLQPGDLLVLNDTKVIPANLVGREEIRGAKVEVLLCKQMPDTRCRIPDTGCQKWECLVKPGKRLSISSKVIFGDGELVGTVLDKTASGEQIIQFESKGDFWEALHKLGEVPLPPYIKKKVERGTLSVGNRYQTVYAEKEGAAAAPTAGLHFTIELLEKIKNKGIQIAYVTLHTGLATFKPVYAERVEDHEMYSEYFEVPPDTIAAVKVAKRVIAVGTTSVRALESLEFNTKTRRHEVGIKGKTNIFIYPGYKFKVVDAIITNFHWPKSTLIMLVSAFAGRDFIFRAYEEAIREQYRFFSFGDVMLVV
ncbi:MAG: tRNA preQ1(34) S-adenosylmethionine ribosyltransferase-isomerase QueA [Candidatus Margulisbacteria bacterium]|nr:tRNA preQ1(34) S-adenosylmethionine ribosyltransferase-isomerase QueA [Candidatus Margulisiibacteriota bacterium]